MKHYVGTSKRVIRYCYNEIVAKFFMMIKYNEITNEKYYRRGGMLPSHHKRRNLGECLGLEKVPIQILAPLKYLKVSVNYVYECRSGELLRPKFGTIFIFVPT